jgi:hypothetical protein
LTSAYKILFTITLRHDYYANKACNDFSVKPTRDCIELLNQYHLIYRQAGNKIIILTPVADGKPLQQITPETTFRFYLFCENVYFTHFTNWDQDDYATKKFYGTNQSNNISQNNRYLTAPLDEYDDKVTYQQGSLVINDSNVVNESLQHNPAGTKSKPLSDKDFWKELTDNRTQYATTNDLVLFTQNLLPLVLIHGAIIKAETFDNKKKDFKKTILEHTVSPNADTSETVKIFSSLPAGRYKIAVNGDEKVHYYDPDPVAKKAWGIIEVHHSNDLPKDMQIIDDDEFFTDTVDEKKKVHRNFIIHFRNRSVLWKYNLRLMKDNYSISDSSANKISFEKKESSFVSKEPIPLSEEPVKTLMLKKDNTALIDVLKNPSINRLNIFEKPDPFDAQKKKTVKYLCSEMYLTI